jgi:asparagine synthetase B (glutamine-hydrolysing)
MCGILLAEKDAETEDAILLLRNRGPDHFNVVHMEDAVAAASVLSIRGSVGQPIVAQDYVLLYNGEIYDEGIGASDTLYLKEIMDSTAERGLDTVRLLHSRMNESECEAAVIIKMGKCVFFFKDDIGRRSLGYTLSPFSASSLGYKNEIDPLRIYCYDLSRRELCSFAKPKSPLISRYLLSMEGITRVLSSQRYPERCRFLDRYREYPHDPQKERHIGCSFEALFLSAVKERLSVGNIAVFFSGGVDSMLLALFLHYAAHPSQDIFLINTSVSSGTFDRKAGEIAHGELCSAFRDRRFFLVKNDVSAEELKGAKSHISKLISPSMHPMDFNIGATLYFTARTARRYSKVAYLGSGADELFRGYSRYRMDAWRDRMLFDVFTISAHNIGRDDRVVSDNSIECRFPFLDTRVVEFGLALSSEMLVGRDGENKAIIRETLRKHGFERASRVAKKAMQYGSGMCKIERRLNCRAGEGNK